VRNNIVHANHFIFVNIYYAEAVINVLVIEIYFPSNPYVFGPIYIIQ